MKYRLVVLTEIISPYRIPLFNALARQENLDPHVIFLSETDPGLRQWQVYKQEIKIPYQVLPSFRKRFGGYNILLNLGITQALEATAPDVILCGGYSYLASWQTLRWARQRRVPVLLWSESNLQDARRGFAPVEFVKEQFLHRCTGFVVPGRSALQYLSAKKVETSRIVTAPNAVDNDLFAAGAADARRDAAVYRQKLGLPERYLVFVGRLVHEKGVFDLLSAYAKLTNPARERIGLVFVGDGRARSRLEERAVSIKPGIVKFTGFAQREPLAAYYALAQALVLPTHTDTWGLVVNEAMACGLPVILSSAAGCAPDLVRQNWNGWLVSPGNIDVLARTMETAANDVELCARMGANAKQHISSYSPDAWAFGVSAAVAATGGIRE
jgi:glycosyltransferase involved in cell wall biosynthesis